MREILFRGKRRDKGWIYGSLLKVTYDGNTYNLIFADNFLFVFGEATAMEHAAVNPGTVGQFTGLTDKNGKKIFEGDIIKAIASNPVGEDVQATVIVSLDDYELMWDIEHSNEIEVIGNIYDNPELLGGGEDGK